ncbi:hypothetical protein [Tahibacter aquaticus]|uniref:hypothetical protein n=1 Tax=Tahibacter aquaticus TaxID=520092 RepID=UPI00105C0CA1|nr:hypothetical protein [Tahibacter aquaticus]
MPTLSSTVLSRLRRHLRVVALLFVGLMVMKTGFAAACAADSLVVLPAIVASVPDAGTAADEPQTTIAGKATSVAEAASESCWHAGAGGCHCACVHVTPLQLQSLDLPTVAASSFRFTVAPAAVRVAPRDDHLRPPIA